MSKPLKMFLMACAGVAGSLLLAALGVYLWLDIDHYRTRLETGASTTLRMDVRIGGPLEIGFWPDPHLTLADVRVRNRDTELAVVPVVRLGIDLWPLLRRQLRIHSIRLLEPSFFLERSPAGIFNFARPAPAAGAPRRPWDLAALAVVGGTLRYVDKKSGEGFSVQGLDLGVKDLRRPAGTTGTPQKLSCSATGSLAEIRGKDWSLSKVAFTVDGKDGVFEVKPIAMGVFGGLGAGHLSADFSEAVPTFQLHYSLSGFRLEEALKVLAPGLEAQGSLDFTAELSGKGRTLAEVERSIAGRAALRGGNLTLSGHDLDQEIARYESSQNFNLVDLTAFFIAGPIGLAATKGYNFASLLQGPGGTSEIRTLVSTWTFRDGVAHATDVALATREHRIVLTGGIDFPSQQLVAVTVAVVDEKGCAIVKQTIHGPFQKPVVEKPNFLVSLAGPAIEFLKKARRFFSGDDCKVFYSGAVAPPP